MKLETHPLVHRPALESAVSAAATARKRLVVVGRPGSGRTTAVQLALETAKFQSFTVNLSGVVREADLDLAFGKVFNGQTMDVALQGLSARAARKRLALILRNVDGCSGVEHESAIVGSLRNQMQRVSRLAVFYTLSDPGFLERNFAVPQAAFWKQAVILEVPSLNSLDVDQWSYSLTSQFIDDFTRAEIIENIGLKAADLSRFFHMVLARRLQQGLNLTTELTVAEVRDVVAALVMDLESHYASWVPAMLTFRQRAFLLAVARGAKARATKQMSEASGIPVPALSAVIASLETAGLVISEGGQRIIADPFLRLYLRTL